MPFRNVTSAAGITYKGTTYALTWGDYDGDGDPDILVTKHNAASFGYDPDPVTLYRNNGNGTFTDVSATALQRVFGDHHGARWADYDNDGDQDVLTSDTSRVGLMAVLYENNGSSGGVGASLQDAAVAAGLRASATTLTAGRNSLWMDYDHDGRMDLIYAYDRVPPSILPAGLAQVDSEIFRQDAPGHFVATARSLGVTSFSGTPLLADLDGDGWQELLFARYGVFGEIYNTHTGTGTWENVRPTWLRNVSLAPFDDACVADFDNDGRPDIYLTRSGVSDEVVLRTPNELRVFIAQPLISSAPPPRASIAFETAGDPTFTFPHEDGTIRANLLVHVGASARDAFASDDAVSFTLSAGDPANQGLPGTLSAPGLYIGYDAAQGEWEFVSLGARPARGATVTSPTPITGLHTAGIALDPRPIGDTLLLNRGPGVGFIDASTSSGVAVMPIFGTSCAAGDFDNDGDVDIYIDQASSALNRGNLLLLNDGHGGFVRTKAAGATGTGLGVGGAVAVADYDHDGWLDILNAAGNSEPPFNALQDGPLQLFRNVPPTTNPNHWLELRLHGNGVDTTTDAVGAKVAIVAGGLTQYRENVLGQHVFAQDSSVVHFGLGRNTTISSVQITWPNATSTTLQNVPVDQILDVTQPAPSSSSRGQDRLGALEGDDHHGGTDLSLALPAGHDDDGSARQPDIDLAFPLDMPDVAANEEQSAGSGTGTSGAGASGGDVADAGAGGLEIGAADGGGWFFA